MSGGIAGYIWKQAEYETIEGKNLNSYLLAIVYSLKYRKQLLIQEA